MANEMSIFQQGGAQLPAHLSKFKEHAKDAAEMVTGFNSLPKISLRGKQFRYIKDDKEYVYPMGTPFKGVILAMDPPKGVAKAWYKDAYDSDSTELPDCFSADGVKPDSFSENKQCRSCAECPLNAFGSGTDAAGNASKGKACSDFKNLFVVESHSLNEGVSVLRVPATSLKNLSAYGRELASNDVPPQLVITAFSFTDAEYPQLEFNAIGWLSEDDAAAMIERSSSDEIQLSLPSKNVIDVDTETGEIKQALPAPPEDIPAPPEKKEPVKVMTARANGISYDAFIAQNWTDKKLIEHGYMELK